MKTSGISQDRILTFAQEKLSRKEGSCELLLYNMIAGEGCVCVHQLIEGI